jgi:hypothetical protein
MCKFFYNYYFFLKVNLFFYLKIKIITLKNIIITLNQEEPTAIYCDNKSTITLSKNHVFPKRTKHIDTRYHFIRELVNNGELILQHCRSKEQLAHIFTKAFTQDQFECFREALGVLNIDVISSRN